MSDIHNRAKALIDGLSDNAAKAIIVLLKNSTSEVAVVAADAKTRPAAAAPAPVRRPRAAAPAPAAAPARRPRAAAPVEEVMEDDTIPEDEQAELPANPTLDDLFAFIEAVTVEPQSRKITEAKADAKAYGGDTKEIEGEGTIGERRDNLEEFVAQCGALEEELTGLSADVLKELAAECGIDSADVKANYGTLTKANMAHAIIFAMNNEDPADGGDELVDETPEPAPAPARRPRAAAAPAAAAPAPRRTRQAAAPAAPAPRTRRPAVEDDGLESLDDL